MVHDEAELTNARVEVASSASFSRFVRVCSRQSWRGRVLCFPARRLTGPGGPLTAFSSAGARKARA